MSVKVGASRTALSMLSRTYNFSGGPRLESKIQQLGVSSSFKILHDRIVTPGDGLIIFQGMQDANTCFKCSAVCVPPYGATSALAKRLGVFRPGWNGRTSRSWLV